MMTIAFTCPNGHKLKVKDSSAGKTGRCPVCHALIRVPRPPGKELDEDEILGILEPRDPSDKPEPPPEGFRDAIDSMEGDTEVGGDMLARKKTCPQCHSEIDLETHICPNCRTYIAGLKDF